MARIAEISTQTNAKGMLSTTSKDLKKQPQARQLAEEAELIKPNIFEEMVKNGKYTPIEEARIELLDYTKSLWK